jgi:cell division protein CrgA
MAPPKRRLGGRVTPKGTQPGSRATAEAPGVARASAASSRYTPPVPRAVKMSPRWVPYLMFGLLGVGIIIILLNYIDLVLPGATNNWYLLVGLLSILGGIVAATQYR